MFILDTALVHVAFVDADESAGLGGVRHTPSNFSFFVLSTGGSVRTKVVGGLEVGEARNWHGVERFLLEYSRDPETVVSLSNSSFLAEPRLILASLV